MPKTPPSREGHDHDADQGAGHGHVHGEHCSHGPQKPVTVDKIGRNDPCTCNSGKKYKRCCGAPK